MWKRLKIYEGIVVINFIINIVFYILNKDFLNHIIPVDIAGYMFWISLGMYLGFQWCKYEFIRVLKLKAELEKKALDKKMPLGHSPN